MSESSGNPKKAATVGEELWEVHLSREVKTDVSASDDVDAVHSKDVNTMSVGEELWRIHCQRAGKDLDKDYDEGAAPPKKTIHLRNRDVKVE